MTQHDIGQGEAVTKQIVVFLQVARQPDEQWHQCRLRFLAQRLVGCQRGVAKDQKGGGIKGRRSKEQPRQILRPIRRCHRHGQAGLRSLFGQRLAYRYRFPTPLTVDLNRGHQTERMPREVRFAAVFTAGKIELVLVNGDAELVRQPAHPRAAVKRHEGKQTELSGHAVASDSDDLIVRFHVACAKRVGEVFSLSSLSQC